MFRNYKISSSLLYFASFFTLLYSILEYFTGYFYETGMKYTGWNDLFSQFDQLSYFGLISMSLLIYFLTAALFGAKRMLNDTAVFSYSLLMSICLVIPVTSFFLACSLLLSLGMTCLGRGDSDV
ncbi:MAG: hypothetical protein PHW04_10520 [Candidatus Wallbacteria bacterium]|nr:hypothetical protein [Candidatus Wallbacteria bacterium]